MTADATASIDSPHEPAPEAGSEGTVRPMLDALLSLVMAVILVRSFAVEGYMISTGSMAPTLPGFHKRATCPKCGYEFAIGLSDEMDALPAGRTESFENAGGESLVSHGAEGHTLSPTQAVCPNCSFAGIETATLPKTQGDQLLVFKNAYTFQEPKRWEVVVFRNPTEPSQAYVKRVVGLPGESVELKQGDVWINGRRARKSLAKQTAVRILVYDHNFEPADDEEWQPRWHPADEKSGWRRNGQTFVFERPDINGGKQPRWVEYRHWLRGGGRHKTVLKVPGELQAVDFRQPSLFPVQYDGARKEIWMLGVMSNRQRDLVSQVFVEPRFRKLIAELAERSHFSPVVDDYGYNLRNRSQAAFAVRDLMLACNVRFTGGAGEFDIELTDGEQRFRLSIDSVTRIVALWQIGQAKPLRSVRLKADALNHPLQLVFSLFDRQVTAAVNGHALFEPVPLEAIPENAEPPRRPVRFGSRGANVRVSDLKLYRDIYYTKKGTEGAYQLADDEYYVLGDNSPISADSRVWAHSGVPRRLFLGKPFLVHLPSRPGNLRIGNREMRVRIPDFSRIRYIR